MSSVPNIPASQSSKLNISQRGAGKITLIVFGLIIFVILYCAYNILPFYYYFYELQNQFESHAKAATIYTDKEIRDKLAYHMHHMEIPANPEDLRIERNDGKMNISLKYKEIFYITWSGKDYDIYTFDFNPKASAPLK